MSSVVLGVKLWSCLFLDASKGWGSKQSSENVIDAFVWNLYRTLFMFGLNIFNQQSASTTTTSYENIRHVEDVSRHFLTTFEMSHACFADKSMFIQMTF